MQPEHRLIVLAYDMFFRLKESIETNMEFQRFAKPDVTHILGFDEKHDLDANLANLGYFIEHVIFNGDASAVFEVATQENEELFNIDAVVEEQEKE